MAPDRVAQLGAPPDQAIANPYQHQRRMLLDRLERNKAHVRTAHRLAQSRSIGRVVLVARNVRLHSLRRNKSHIVAKPPKDTTPVMRASARLQTDNRRRLLLEKLHNLATTKRPAQDNTILVIDGVNLKNLLRRIHTNSGNLVHGRLLSLEIVRDLILAPRCRRGAVHTNML